MSGKRKGRRSVRFQVSVPGTLGSRSGSPNGFSVRSNRKLYVAKVGELEWGVVTGASSRPVVGHGHQIRRAAILRRSWWRRTTKRARDK